MRGQTTNRHQQDNPATADNRDMTQPPCARRAVRYGRQPGFLTCGSLCFLRLPSPPPSPSPSRGEGWEGVTSGLSAGALSAYSGGTVMDFHHLPLSVSSLSCWLPS